MAVYDVRLQQFDRDFDVLTRDGLMMSVNISVRYRLNDGAVGLLHKHVGPAYVDTLLVPTVGSLARIVFSQNSTDAVYTDRRSAVQTEIKTAMVSELGHYAGETDSRGLPLLFLDDVLIRSMRFPPALQSAVNRKMEEYQLRQEYAYRLQREKLESERKEIEAQGIAEFQRIVGAGINDTYLRWKGIDATLALAQSPNAKIIVIGTGKDGMPLILGGMDSSPALLSSSTEHSKPAVTREAPPSIVSSAGENKPTAQQNAPMETARTQVPAAIAVPNNGKR
jgi:regulator of protease activity HflC (stomatin/prohibitin superfamily)